MHQKLDRLTITRQIMTITGERSENLNQSINHIYYLPEQKLETLVNVTCKYKYSRLPEKL